MKTWIDILGALVVIGTLLGALGHAATRVWAARRRTSS